MQLLIHSQTSAAEPLKFGNGYLISAHTLLSMWLLIHAGIKVILFVVKRGPWWKVAYARYLEYHIRSAVTSSYGLRNKLQYVIILEPYLTLFSYVNQFMLALNKENGIRANWTASLAVKC